MQRMLNTATPVVKPGRIAESNARCFIRQVTTKTPFEDAVEELRQEHGGKSATALAMAAGLSHGTMSQWLRKAKKQRKQPGSTAKLAQLARHYGKSVDWFLDPAVRAQNDATGPREAGTLAMAREAARALEELDEVPFEQGWALMAQMAPSQPDSALRLYRQARLELKRKPRADSGRARAGRPGIKRTPVQHEHEDLGDAVHPRRTRQKRKASH